MSEVATIDDDVFKYDNSPLSQCISGFGRNAKSYLRELVTDLEERDPENDPNEENEHVAARVKQIEYHIDELTRWCRGFNQMVKERAAEDLLRPLDEWSEDDGFALWWFLTDDKLRPLTEPPFCGSPLDSDWPGYHTHWSRIHEPEVKEVTK